MRGVPFTLWVINVSEEVDTLVKEGRHKDAAEAARTAQDYGRAATLFEGIWQFADAAICAELDGDLPRALSNALEARDREQAASYADALQAEGKSGKEKALAVFAKRRHFAKAAALAEELDKLDDAISYYQQGHLDLDAARLLIDVGRKREAGKLLERVVRNLDAGNQRSRANLQLGLLLSELMQHKSAIRALQDASADDESRPQALRALVMEFSALGLRDSARDILSTLHQSDPSVASNLEEFVRSERKPAQRGKAGEKKIQIIGGRYQVEELLGSGASGRVYRALDQVRERVVALKLIAGSHAPGSDAYVRFAREAKLATTLRHPNLVETYDVSPEQGYLVMEYMSGAALDGKLGEAMPPASVKRMALDVLAGLELAHTRGIIHRDIKPANIFFDVRGTAKIGDFGVAHLLDMGQTQTGGLIGTLAYMSPEQITGAPLTIAADLYGLGVTIYQALTGRLPFLGPDFVAQHLGDTAPAPSFLSDCDQRWDAILLKLLQKNPGDRFASIEVLRHELNDLDFSEAFSPLALHRASHSSVEGDEDETENISDEKDAESEEEEEEKPRYSFETPLRETGHSRLSRAIDTTLDRSVIIERWNEALDEESERRLFALARGGGPFLQRALSYDRAEGVAIFEAPTGNALSDWTESLSTRLAVRLFKRLARAVAPLHNNDRAHGAINGTTILLDDRGHPTVLVCGLEAASDTIASPEHDSICIIKAVLQSILGPNDDNSEPDILVSKLADKSLARALIENILPDTDLDIEKLVEMPLGEGEELYSFAEALELRLLEQKQGRAL